MRSSSFPIRRVLSAAAAGLLVAVVSLVGASPAAASTANDYASLQSQLSAGTGDNVITLSADIDTTGAGWSGGPANLSVGRPVKVDLNGHAIISARVWVGGGLTITDTSAGSTGSWTATGSAENAGFMTLGGVLTIVAGTVTATGGDSAAGIGGNIRYDGGTTIIHGGSVYAYGGSQAAGIGGGQSGKGGTITIDGGTVTAVSGGLAAAIGGGYNAAGGTTTISGGTVTATGVATGAGIGGGYHGAPGTVLISGGNVTATGGYQAAGIGGGIESTTDGSITISGGTVVANGGSTSAGIGGGQSGAGITTTITGGSVTATGGSSAAGIGTGWTAGNPLAVTRPLTLGASAPSTSVLSLAASSVRSSTMTITEGTTVTVPASATLSVESPLTNDGLIIVNGTLTGTTTVTNNGSIRPAANVNTTALTITVNNYDIDFYSDGPVVANYRAYAATLAGSGYIDSGLTLAGYVVGSWNTEFDRSGTDMNLTTDLDSVDSAGAITVWATWIAQEFTVATGTNTATIAGTVINFVSLLSGDLGAWFDVSNMTTLTSNNRADTIVGDSITFATAGDRIITSTHLGYSPTIAVTIVTGELDTLSITPSAATVAQGGTLSFTVEGADVDSNPIVILPADVVLTSDVATDVVSGLTVSFPHASPHVITATVRGVSDSFTIEVRAATLAATGLSLTNQTLAAGAALIAVGGLLLALRSRRRAA